LEAQIKDLQDEVAFSSVGGVERLAREAKKLAKKKAGMNQPGVAARAGT
jgi:hypothetical protein